MAIIRVFYQSNYTVYATIRDRAGAIWNGSSFEGFSSGNWGNYDIQLTEDGTSGYYKGVFPAAIPAGYYDLLFYRQAGGSPSMSDPKLNTGSLRFDGTDEETGIKADFASEVWNRATSSHVSAGSFGQRLQILRAGTAQDGASGTITLDSGASSIDDFYNNQIIQIVSGTGAGQSRIISDYVGSTRVASVDTNWVTSPDNTSVFLMHPLGSIPGATAPSASQVASAVWDKERGDHTTAGSFGEGVITESLNTQAKADVNAEADAALVDIRLNQLISAAASPATPTQNSLIDYIMNRNSGQTFNRDTMSLQGIKETGSGPSAGDVALAVWQRTLDSSFALNTAGERLRAIDEKLPSGNISGFDQNTHLVNLNNSQTGVVIGTVNNLGATARGQVNAEVVDVMTADVISELSVGAPPTNPTVVQALMLLYMALRNRRETTASQTRIFNNAGTAVALASVSDDDTTFVKDRFGAP